MWGGGGWGQAVQSPDYLSALLPPGAQGAGEAAPHIPPLGPTFHLQGPPYSPYPRDPKSASWPWAGALSSSQLKPEAGPSPCFLQEYHPLGAPGSKCAPADLQQAKARGRRAAAAERKYQRAGITTPLHTRQPSSTTAERRRQGLPQNVRYPRAPGLHLGAGHLPLLGHLRELAGAESRDVSWPETCPEFRVPREARPAHPIPPLTGSRSG